MTKRQRPTAVPTTKTKKVRTRPVSGPAPMAQKVREHHEVDDTIEPVRSRSAKPLLKAEKAYKNEGFLNSKSARPIRILSEFFEPLSRFEYYAVKDTVVFFGSARIKPPATAEKELALVRKKISLAKRVSPKLKDLLKVAETGVAMSKYYDDAVELARMLTEWTKKMKRPNRFIVCSGGGPGIMEAANKGASLAKGKSVGLNISLPFEQYPNGYISPELNFEFHYFFMRKYWFMYLGKALIAFPGGFGTLDELMELLTLLQTQKIKKKMTVVLFGRQYWNEVINFRALIKYGMIGEEDMALFTFADTPEEAFGHLTRSLERNYSELFE
ncbi:MAG TPA: LOG family protein [Bacteroidota bacterium]|nr:LOG family protein [Bacteroidota bacterium]